MSERQPIRRSDQRRSRISFAAKLIFLGTPKDNLGLRSSATENPGVTNEFACPL